MIQFLFRPFEDMDEWWEYLMFGFLWILSWGIIILTGYGVFYITDSCFLPEKKGKAVITGVYDHPAHYTTTFITTGKTMIPITNYIPESWSVDVVLKGEEDGVGVSENYYNQANVGDTVEVDFTNGRFSGDLYVETIY